MEIILLKGNNKKFIRGSTREVVMARARICVDDGWELEADCEDKELANLSDSLDNDEEKRFSHDEVFKPKRRGRPPKGE